jgi:hypothetical protein
MMILFIFLDAGSFFFLIHSPGFSLLVHSDLQLFLTFVVGLDTFISFFENNAYFNWTKICRANLLPFSELESCFLKKPFSRLINFSHWFIT